MKAHAPPSFTLRLWRSTTLRIVLAAFFVYNANLRSITSFDTNPTRYLPISILTEFDLDLDEFAFLHEYPKPWLQAHPDFADSLTAGAPPYFVQQVRGHYMSSYPVMPAILATPVYALPVLLGLTEGSASGIGYTQTEIVGTFLSKVSASAAVAGSVGIIFLALLRLTSRRSALWISLIYAFATSSWAVSSQGLWQTSMSQPCLALALYCLVRAKERPRWVLWAGLALALAVACRPPVVIYATVLLGYVVHRHRARVGYFVLFPVVIAALLASYNYYYFGGPLGGYTEMAGNQFIYPQLKNLLGLLISPSRGLLTHSPVLVFSLLGLAVALLRRRDSLMTYTAVATILSVLFYSTWLSWHGAFSFSYRFLVDLLPGLALLLALVFEAVCARRWMRHVLVLSVGFSVGVQIIGAFCYPCGWDESPVSATAFPERFWDWSDPEFVRCLRCGPVDPDGLRFLREMVK